MKIIVSSLLFLFAFIVLLLQTYQWLPWFNYEMSLTGLCVMNTWSQLGILIWMVVECFKCIGPSWQMQHHREGWDLEDDNPAVLLCPLCFLWPPQCDQLHHTPTTIDRVKTSTTPPLPWWPIPWTMSQNQAFLPEGNCITCLVTTMRKVTNTQLFIFIKGL